MRYGIVAFSLFGLAIASTGCSRDAVDVDFSADADRAIRFEGRCDDATRAVPGDPADGKVPVYWCDGDAVSVACAQATPSVGRYVLTPDIFDYLEKVKPGHGGEIQLTDALQAMAKDRGMMAVRMAGMRFDAGDWAEFLSANIYFALQDESLRYELLGLLKNFVQFK